MNYDKGISRSVKRARNTKKFICLQKDIDKEKCWKEFQLDIQEEMKLFDQAVDQFDQVKSNNLVASDSIYDQGLLKSNISAKSYS